MITVQCWRSFHSKLTGIHVVASNLPVRGASQLHRQRQARLKLCLVLCLSAAHLCTESFLSNIAGPPQAVSASRTSRVVTSRRSMLLLPLSPSLGAAMLAPVGARADMRLDYELPPLPRAYRDTVVDLATATKNALLTALKGSRDSSQQSQAQLDQEEATVVMLVRRYEENFVGPSSTAKLDATLLEHPIYFAMQRAIGELKSGGRRADNMQSFRLDLIREMNAILRLADRAGLERVNYR
mmetsp:Transcript_30612/g.60057  ORF Transcript_30612/g.60057 Transcript_30612/m.60057 type:complete len:240 (+) Transcript_30612:37-756(+)